MATVDDILSAAASATAGVHPETLASLLSGIAAQPVAGWAGITAPLWGGDPAAAVRATQDALTYQPRTQGGKAQQASIGEAGAKVLGPYEQFKNWLGDKTLDATGSPALATAAFTGPDALLSMLPFMRAENLGNPMIAGSRAAQEGSLKVGSRATLAGLLKKAQKEGGATAPVSGAEAPSRGYAVGMTGGGEQTVLDPAAARPADLEAFMREHKMTDADSLGLWINPDDGKLYLDASKVYPSRFRALNEGNANDQLAIYDLGRGQNVTTHYGEMNAPTPSSPLVMRKTVIGGDVARPGIYDNPARIVSDSARMVGPENPLLSELFGETRQSLDEAALQGSDPSIASPIVYQGTRAPAHTLPVTTPGNAQRLQNIISLALEDPRFAGMPGWYQTQAILRSAEEILGPEAAAQFFREHHLWASPMSASSTVQKEIAKGTFAHLLDRQGRIGEFYDTQTLPAGMNQPAHSTAHSAGARNMEASDNERFWSASDPSPKTPTYFFTKTGENKYWPTGDAHFVRMTGLPDTRSLVLDKNTGARVFDESSIGKTELGPVGQWFANDVAAPLGLGSDVGQPVLWGAGASRTGVKSAIGAPYLEILATNIAKSAKRQGITPRQAWVNYVLGHGDPYKAYLGTLMGAGVLGGGLLGSNEDATQN